MVITTTADGNISAMNVATLGSLLPVNLILKNSRLMTDLKGNHQPWSYDLRRRKLDDVNLLILISQLRCYIRKVLNFIPLTLIIKWDCEILNPNCYK